MQNEALQLMVHARTDPHKMKENVWNDQKDDWEHAWTCLGAVITDGALTKRQPVKHRCGKQKHDNDICVQQVHQAFQWWFTLICLFCSNTFKDVRLHTKMGFMACSQRIMASKLSIKWEDYGKHSSSESHSRRKPLTSPGEAVREGDF